LLSTVNLIVAERASAQDLSRSMRIVADNDYFIFWVPPDRRSDDNYTQGLRVSWDPVGAPALARRLICHTMSSCGSQVEVGQEIYTPTKDAPTPLPGERPYAGWLYGLFTVAPVTLLACGA
jgi:hypothetical protein